MPCFSSLPGQLRYAILVNSKSTAMEVFLFATSANFFACRRGRFILNRIEQSRRFCNSLRFRCVYAIRKKVRAFMQSREISDVFGKKSLMFQLNRR
jgi:hypothetical protein